MGEVIDGNFGPVEIFPTRFVINATSLGQLTSFVRSYCLSPIRPHKGLL